MVTLTEIYFIDSDTKIHLLDWFEFMYVNNIHCGNVLGTFIKIK